MQKKVKRLSFKNKDKNCRKKTNKNEDENCRKKRQKFQIKIQKLQEKMTTKK